VKRIEQFTEALHLDKFHMAGQSVIEETFFALEEELDGFRREMRYV
jgi:hypothetical protein